MYKVMTLISIVEDGVQKNERVELASDLSWQEAKNVRSENRGSEITHQVSNKWVQGKVKVAKSPKKDTRKRHKVS